MGTERTARVVIVEDDQSVRSSLSAVLNYEGYDVVECPDAETALRLPDLASADLIVLDVGLPGIDGLECCALLRRRGHTGSVLMLTARHEVKDRVVGLDAGADDYLVKPFSLDELLARVRAAVRRSESEVASTESPVALEDLVVDPVTRQATRSEVALELTKIEFDLLHLLIKHTPMVLTRESIHEQIWGYGDEHMSNSLEVFVSQLRRKSEANGGARLIHTVRGVGYVARSA